MRRFVRRFSSFLRSTSGWTIVGLLIAVIVLFVALRGTSADLKQDIVDLKKEHADELKEQLQTAADAHQNELKEQLQTAVDAHQKEINRLETNHADEIAELESQHALDLLAEKQEELRSLRQKLSAQTQVADTAKGLSISRTLSVRVLGCLLLNHVDEDGEYTMSVPGGEAVVLVIETNGSEVSRGVRFVDSTGIPTEILWC